MARVLVIDDDDAVRSVLIEILETAGYEVAAAADGSTGIALAREEPPDLVLCDIVMRSVDGYSVLSALRLDSASATVPVIFLTGVSGPTALRKGMDLGADDYLVKPVTEAALVAAVEARLERSTAMRQEGQRRLDELRTNLAQSLPHEFLTPLTATIGLSSLLMEDGAVEPADVKEVARAINLAGQSLQDMMGKYLLYAELGALERADGAGLEPSRIASVVKEAADGKAARVGREGDVKIETDPVRVPLNKDHLHALVEALVENALAASSPGSPVVIGCHGDGESCVVSVADSGKGMAPEQLDALQKRAPFLRRFQDQPGLGLGLSIVRRLATLHSGEVSFHTSPGQGTTVRVRFPLASSPAAAD
jgi:two-component system, sensor histidine kinase and response regulator